MTRSAPSSPSSAGTPKAVLSPDQKTLTIQIPFKIRMHRSGKQIVSPTGEPWSVRPRIDNALVQAVVRAHRWREMLESGKYGTAADLAKAEGVNDSYLSRVLRLTLLAPDLVEAILDGQQSRTLELKNLLSPLPSAWADQRTLLGNG